MQTAVWTSFLIELSPEDALRRFAEAQWTALELSDEHGRQLLERGDPAHEGSAFRRFADNLGVALPQGHLWLHSDILAQDCGKTLDKLRRWIDLYAAVGVRNAVLHPGGEALIEAGASLDDINARRAEALGALLDHAAGSGLRLCLENCPAQAGTARELMAILEATDRTDLGVCLDTGHLHLVGGEQAEFIREVGDKLWALHVADNDTSRDQHIMPFGCGTIDWTAFAVALRASDYQGLVNLEIPGERRCPPAVQLAKLRYLRVAMNELLALGA